MKHYIQFKTLSTGYPTYLDKDKKPIDKLGSDGIYYLDNRLSFNNMIYKGVELCKSFKNKVGFSIVKYNNSILDGREIKTVIF